MSTSEDDKNTRKQKLLTNIMAACGFAAVDAIRDGSGSMTVDTGAGFAGVEDRHVVVEIRFESFDPDDKRWYSESF